MNIDLAKDRFVTHSILNYLNASYQGKFAAFNILSQLQHPRFDPDEMSTIQFALEQIASWVKQLYQDECLFSASWTQVETFEAQQAIDLMHELKPELYQVANETARILSLETVPSAGELKYMLAVLSRQIYSRDNYIRGFIQYGQTFKLPDMEKKYEELLATSTDQLQQVHELINIFRSANMVESNLQPPFFAFLHRLSLNLPAIFKTHIHDLNQLLAPFKGGFNFQNAEFTKVESQAWQNAGLGPVPAGYWRAYGIGPDEAQIWSQARFTDVAFAIEWRNLGFQPEIAALWAEQSFAPDYAVIWLQAGYSPLEARELIEKGLTEPPRQRESL